MPALPCDGKEQVRAHCNPDLGIYCVFGVTIECFDLQVLFDPFEEFMQSFA